MNDSDDKSKSLIQISDLLGLAKGADRLVSGIERGVGAVLASWLSRRNHQAQISNLENWNNALQKTGLSIKQADLSLAERASVRIIADDIRRQRNREQIAIEAIREFQETNQDESLDELTDFSPEWLDKFWSLAENITNEKMQIVWGRILARQSIGKGAFSGRSLQTLSMLSGDEARFLEKLAPFIMTSNLDEKPNSFALTRLSTHFADNDENKKAANEALAKTVGPLKREIFGPAGIYLDAGGTSWAFGINVRTFNGFADLKIAGKHFRLRFINEREGIVSLGSGTGLSDEGAQIMSLIHAIPSQEYLDRFQEACSAHGIELIAE